MIVYQGFIVSQLKPSIRCREPSLFHVKCGEYFVYRRGLLHGGFIHTMLSSDSWSPCWFWPTPTRAEFLADSRGTASVVFRFLMCRFHHDKGIDKGRRDKENLFLSFQTPIHQS